MNRTFHTPLLIIQANLNRDISHKTSSQNFAMPLQENKTWRDIMKSPLSKPLEITEANYLPISRSIIRRIQLEETIDRLVPSEMRVSVSQIVSGLVLDALSGRTPLFRLQESFGTQDQELLFGGKPPAGTFSDHNVGRVLDKVFQTGTTKIFSEIAQQAIRVFEIDPSRFTATPRP